MSKNDELENLDGGLPHCCENPADKLDSKMSEQEQFILYCKNECDPDSGGFANEKLCLKCKIAYLTSKLSKVREWVENEIKSIPKTKFNRKEFPVSHVAWIQNETRRKTLKELKQILEGK